MESTTDRMEIENMSSAEIQRLISDAVADATGSLQQEVKALRKELRENRRVITHQEAPKFFNQRVSPRRVKEYIKGKNLPNDAPAPLPAKKMGNLYFIELETLFDWQMGEVED